jgi:HD-GYP domain-containing protein (c-di-GMP phosphodiesterase class II)
MKSTFDPTPLLSLVDVTERAAYRTYGHMWRVAQYARLMLSKLNVSDKDKSLIGIAALVHDIGKIGVPNALLRKTGVLTTEEIGAIEKHTEIGFSILTKAHAELYPFVNKDEFFAMAAMVKYHHENVDGSGPYQLKGEGIPFGSRVLRVADAVDSLGSESLREHAKPMAEIVNAVMNDKDVLYDSQIVGAFVGTLRKNPGGYENVYQQGLIEDLA